jgi:hypothetical protein
LELRAGRFRVFYEVDESLQKVTVVAVGHKEDDALLIQVLDHHKRHAAVRPELGQDGANSFQAACTGTERYDRNTCFYAGIFLSR